MKQHTDKENKIVELDESATKVVSGASSDVSLVTPVAGSSWVFNSDGKNASQLLTELANEARRFDVKNLVHVEYNEHTEHADHNVHGQGH